MRSLFSPRALRIVRHLFSNPLNYDALASWPRIEVDTREALANGLNYPGYDPSKLILFGASLLVVGCCFAVILGA